MAVTLEQIKKLFQTEIQKELKKALEPIKQDLKKLNNYNQRTDEVYEEDVTDVLMADLRQNVYKNPGKFSIKKIFLRNIYDEKSTSPLTDLDGCILVEETVADRIISLNNANKKLNSLKKERLQSGGINSNKYMFIIESKRHFLKTEVDKKIRQMIQFEMIIQKVQNRRYDVSQSSLQFNEFVQSNHDELHQIPDVINKLFFATESMPEDVIQYIKHLSNATMTKEVYESITYKMMMNYKGFHDFRKKLHNIIGYKTLDNYLDIVEMISSVNRFMKTNTSNALKKALNNYDTKEFIKDAKFYETFSMEYDPLLYEWAKRKLGIIHKGKVLIIDDVPSNDKAILYKVAIGNNDIDNLSTYPNVIS